MIHEDRKKFQLKQTQNFGTAQKCAILNRNKLTNYYYKQKKMEVESTLACLPKRNRGNYLRQISNQVQIVSNYYPVRIKVIEKIFIFKIIFEPSIMNDNRVLREKLLKEASQSIKRQINNPVIGGMNIYSVSAPNKAEETHQTSTHKITVKQIKSFNVKQNQKVLLHFLNNGIRNIMKILNYMEIGDTGKYFSKAEKKDLPPDFSIYPGYKVNFLLAQGGLYLRVDPTSKLVQTTTVLTVIDQIYKSNMNKQREEKRQIVKQSLINKIVMTNYGKTRYVRIQDIEFLNLNEFLIPMKNETLTILDYYKKKYHIEPRSNQPLIKIHNKNKNDKTPVYMLPQLCLMTGLPDNIDEIKRKRISDQTCCTTKEKFDSIKNFVKQIKKTQQQNCLQQLGIKIQNAPEKIYARGLKNPVLMLGNKNKVQTGKQYQFQLFSQPIYQAKQSIKLGIIYVDGCQETNDLIQTFTNTSQKLGVNLSIKKFTISGKYYRPNQVKNQIIATLKGPIKQNCNQCLIILKKDMKSEYKDIKRQCLQIKKIVTQVVLQTTLKKKNARSIHTKILLQIIAKAGNILWCPQISKQIDKKTMLVSFDTSKTGQKRRLAGIATINSSLTKYTTQSVDLDTIENKFQNMVKMLLSFVNKYFKHNKENQLLEIIVLTNSCPRNQVKLYYDYFIPHFKKQIRDIKHLKIIPKLTVVQVKDLSNQRFFQITEMGRSVSNPRAGLIVSNTIVSQNYDFYMVPQKTYRGCSVPIRFNVISSDSNLEQGILQELMFSQCFGYANFTGSIKIPAIMQYAKKLARFCSEVLKKNLQSQDSLTNRLYFI